MELSATIRTFDGKVRDLIEKRFNEITSGIGTTFGGVVKLDYQRRYPPQINDEKLALAAIDALKPVFGDENVVTNAKPSMGGEDFAFMSEAVPGVYMKVGLRDKDHQAALHNPGFDFNDLALANSVEAFRAIVEARLPLKG